jgi:hypothetical protein
MEKLKNMIKLIEDEIIEIDFELKRIEDRSSYLYKKGMEFLRNVESYDTERKLREKKESLKKTNILYKKLLDENVDVDKTYYLTDDVHMMFWARDNGISVGFYLEGDRHSEYYNKFYGSHSELNTWISGLVVNSFNAFVGNGGLINSMYGFDLESIVNKLEHEKPLITFDRIKLLINFIEEDKEVRNKVIQNINEVFARIDKQIEEK